MHLAWPPSVSYPMGPAETARQTPEHSAEAVSFHGDVHADCGQDYNTERDRTLAA